MRGNLSTRKGSLSLTVGEGEIPAAGKRFLIEASEAECRALAAELGIAEVTALAADIEVRPRRRSGFTVDGTLMASVVQEDVVTLEPVPKSVNEAIELVLVPEEDAPTQAAAETDAEDPPDVYTGGMIALGALLREHLAVALDPYPRAPGVEFEGHIEDDSRNDPSPLAVLAKLKKNED